MDDCRCCGLSCGRSWKARLIGTVVVLLVAAAAGAAIVAYLKRDTWTLSEAGWVQDVDGTWYKETPEDGPATAEETATVDETGAAGDTGPDAPADDAGAGAAE